MKQDGFALLHALLIALYGAEELLANFLLILCGLKSMFLLQPGLACIGRSAYEALHPNW